MHDSIDKNVPKTENEVEHFSNSIDKKIEFEKKGNVTDFIECGIGESKESFNDASMFSSMLAEGNLVKEIKTQIISAIYDLQEQNDIDTTYFYIFTKSVVNIKNIKLVPLDSLYYNNTYYYAIKSKKNKKEFFNELEEMQYMIYNDTPKTSKMYKKILELIQK